MIMPTKETSQVSLRRLFQYFAVGLLGVLTTATPAQGAFGIASFGGQAVDSFGDRVSQAGSHPNVSTRFSFRTRIDSDGYVVPDENEKDISVRLPAGLIGNPQAVPTCTVEQLNGLSARCPVASQVGVIYTAQSNRSAQSPGDTPALNSVPAGVYNVVAPLGAPARFAANIGGVLIFLEPKLRVEDDYGVTVDSPDTSQGLPVVSAAVTLWGVPADPANDDERLDTTQVSSPPGASSTAPRRAFITTPTSCDGDALKTTLTANSWQHPEIFDSASFSKDFDGFPLINEGCDQLGFEPTAAFVPSTAAPDAPTGLAVDLSSPQNLADADGLANAQLKEVTVTLPEGLTVNPGAADGLQACSDEQLGLASRLAATCPAASKLGSATASTPLLAESVDGDIYLRTQNSDVPESGEMFRVALVLDSPERGIVVKLAGALKVDANTGRLTASFRDNPQLPVENVKLAMKAGPRAPLATPQTCGAKTIGTNLTSWAGHSVSRSDSFTVLCTPGLGGFGPSLIAGTVNPAGATSSAFTLSATKPDGDAAVNGLRLDLPTGLLARLKGNLGQQVGTVKAFAGSGSNPFALPGKVFVEGRYDDAPFSLKVIVPAKAGPFDLGDVIVRQKIYVDPIDAHVTVVSDPIPTIVKGVPVRLQRLDVDVDKPNFVINPTSCAAKSIEGVLGSVAGQTAALSMRFQVSECAALDLKPSLALSLSGKGQTTDGKHPAVTANLTQPAGQANLKKVRVALPLSLALDPDNANGLCEFVDGSKVTPTCPKASIVGTATAVTPILDEPLSGPVYFVKNIRKDPKSGREIRTLPKLVIPLVGQNGLKLTLTGTSNVEDDQLVTTFDNIPDAPVSSFKLSINGGKGGILTVSDADICKSTQIAEQQVDGQNNKSADADVFIQTPSCALKVLSKKVGKSSVTLKVGGLGAGKVTVSGKGIKKTIKTITKSTVATITAKRTKGKPKQIKVSFLAKGTKKAKVARESK
jgi:hypothetical protein